jgi:TonB family protein
VIGQPTLPQPRTDLSLKITVLGVGIDRRGGVISALVEESCGDPSVDQLAVQSVQSWLFSPRTGGADADWGRVVVFWDLNEKRAPEPATNP